MVILAFCDPFHEIIMFVLVLSLNVLRRFIVLQNIYMSLNHWPNSYIKTPPIDYFIT